MTDAELCYVTFDWGSEGGLWPSFEPVPPDPRLDERHRIMTVAEAGELFGQFRGSSGTGLPYTPRPDLVRREMAAVAG